MKATRLFLIAILMMVFSLPVSAASAVQVYKCKLLEGKTQEDIMTVSKQWLDAAKTMKGGENLEVYIDFPVVGKSDGAFSFVMIASDLETWGTFTNGYPGSAAAKADEDWYKAASCSYSSLGSSTKVE